MQATDTDFRVLTEWQPYRPWIPFKDAATGGWTMSNFGERRRVLVDGKKKWQKRAVLQTYAEWLDDQW